MYTHSGCADTTAYPGHRLLKQIKASTTNGKIIKRAKH